MIDLSSQEFLTFAFRVNPFLGWQQLYSGIILNECISEPEFSAGIGQFKSCEARSNFINRRANQWFTVLSFIVLLMVRYQ